MTAVVLLHGFPLDRRMWQDQARDLRAAGHEVLDLDLPGFGGTATPTQPPSLRVLADAVAEAMDRAGMADAVVAGLSMGGYVAMEMLRRCPERIRALALIDTKATADTDEARENRERIAVQVLESGSTEALARTMSQSLLGATSRTAAPHLADLLAQWIREAPPATVAWAQRAMAARPDSRPDLAGVTVPTVVVWGDEDEVSPPADQRAMLAVLPDAVAVEVPAAGHMTTIEAPERVTQALLELIARATP